MSWSDAERFELPRLGLKESDFFNAELRSIPDCKFEMKSKNKLFAHNARPCRSGGHTLRTRSNHCIICNPQSFFRHKQKMKIGYLYVAVSERGKVFKVGTSENISERRKSLRSQRYAEQWDWEIIWEFESAAFDTLEAGIHAQLKKFSLCDYSTYRADKQELSKEVFRCNWIDLAAAIKLIIPECTLRIPRNRLEADFDFRNQTAVERDLSG